MGPVWWKKCSSLILSMIKSDQMIFFGLLFQPVLKVIENAFARDLGGIRLYNNIWDIDWATSNHDHDLSLRVGHSDTQLGHSTPVHRLAERTEREIIRQRITLPAIACVLCPLSGRQNKFVSSRG